MPSFAAACLARAISETSNLIEVVGVTPTEILLHIRANLVAVGPPVIYYALRTACRSTFLLGAQPKIPVDPALRPNRERA